MKCRNCKCDVLIPFVDLGTSPPSNSYLNFDQLQTPEIYFPLRIKVCRSCWLVQTEDFAEREIFFSKDYAYFSSVSKTCLNHSERYVSKVVPRFDLGSDSFVVEVASNDGYLLQFIKERGIPCLGIEPTEGTANASIEKGIPTIKEFFDSNLARTLIKEYKQANLIIANNVLAHVPDINDFLSGFFILLNDRGVITFEFPHLLKMVENVQFDTIYHEHYSYLSLIAVQNILKRNGLEVFDVDELETHGGSLRIYVQKETNISRRISEKTSAIIQKEMKAGIDQKRFYEGFQDKINICKNETLELLLKAKHNNDKVVGYGAAAKGNTFLNYAGIRSDLVPFVVDKNIHKQNKFLPGSRIPIYDETLINQIKPAYLIIFPWNIKDEICEQLSYIREWNGKFVTCIPKVEVF